MAGFGTPVTDPDLLKQLNTPDPSAPVGSPVDDPATLAELNAKPGMSLSDLAKSAGAGLVRGAATSFGAPYDIGKLMRAGAGYVGDYVDDKVPFLRRLDDSVGLTKGAATNQSLQALVDPNSGYGASRIDDLLNKMGIADYKPQSAAGDSVYNVAHFAGGALPYGLVGPAKEGLVSTLTGVGRNLAKEALIGTGAGVGSETARRAADAVDLDKPWARVALEGAGALAGGMAGAATANKSVLFQKSDLAKDFDAAGVKPRFPSDIGSDSAAAKVALEKMLPTIPGAKGTSVNSAKETQKELGDYARDVTGSNSTPSLQLQGEQLQSDAQKTVAGLRQEVNDAYSNLDALVPPDTAVSTTNSSKALQDLTNRAKDPDVQELFKNPTYQKYSTILSKPQLEWSDVQMLRQEIGQSIPAASGPEQGLLKGLYSAISDDMRGTAGQTPEGLEAFEKANQTYRTNSAKTEEITKNLIDQTPETRPGWLWQQSSKGASRLDDMLADGELGANRAQTGQWLLSNAGQTNDGFNLDRLMDQWKKLSPEYRQAVTGDPDVSEGMDRLSRLYNATDTSRELAKKPAPGGVSDYVLGGLLAGGGSALQGGLLDPINLTKSVAGVASVPLAAWGASKAAQSPGLVSRFMQPNAGNMIPLSQGAATAGAAGVENVFPDVYTRAPQPDVQQPPVKGDVHSWLGTTDRASATAYIDSKLGPQIAQQLPQDDNGFKAALFNMAANPEYRAALQAGQPVDEG
jgi:hypothetical protein